jgi:hypothetical protein
VTALSRYLPFLLGWSCGRLLLPLSHTGNAAEDELRLHLDSGEKLLWAGRPAQRIVLTWQDGYLIPFGVLLIAAGLRFIPMGIYTLIVGRLLANLWYRSRLIYGITDRRAIILSDMRRRSVYSIYFSTLITLKLEEHRNRSGTIYFGEDHPSSSYWDGAYYGSNPWQGDDIAYAPGGRTRLGEKQFFRIADAKRVYTILHEAIRRQRRRSSAAPIRR